MLCGRWSIVGLCIIVTGCGEAKRDILGEEKSAVELARQMAAGGYKLIDTKSLSEFVSSRSDMVLLDVRPSGDFRKAHILGSTNIPFPAEKEKEWDTKKMDGLSADQFAMRLSKDPNMRVVIYSEDLTCTRSHTAATWAKKLGFTDVNRYAGGIEAWKAAGHETRSIKN